MLIYLAGCYTRHRIKWLPRQIATPLNVLYAWRKSRQLWAMGFHVICPMTNTAFMDGATDYEGFMKGCFDTIDRVDAVVMLPNWIYSPGARRELHYAIEKGKQIIYFGEKTDRACQEILDTVPYGYVLCLGHYGQLTEDEGF